MAWGEINVVQQRRQFVEAVRRGDQQMADLCRQYNISRKNGYKWLHRYECEGEDGLINRSKAPLKQALKTEPEIEEAILQVRYQFPTWGPKKVLARLRLDQPEISWPSTTTIHNLFDRKGLLVPRKHRKRVPGRTCPLSHCQVPNDVWCTDFKGWFVTQDGSKSEPFTLTDGATRFLLRCLDLDSNDIEHVWAVLDAAFREYGLPRFMRHDNGPPFGTCGVARLSRLSVKLIKAGVIPEWIDPGKPQQNGRHERMHQTLKNETSNPPALNLEMQAGKYKEFKNYYNFIRPHEAIGQITPGSIYNASSRQWTGRLKSPEYPEDYIVRKVKSCGKLSWKWEELYIGRTLANEPIGLKEHEGGAFTAYYGPIILGIIDAGKTFHTPEGYKRWRGQRQPK